MTHRIAKRACAALVAGFATALVLGAPAHANPASGTDTTVQMQMPGAGSSGGGGSDSAYQSAPVTLAEQGGGGGVDLDGTAGVIDPDGTTGTVTGPLLRATPAIHAAPAPGSPRVKS